MNGPVIFSNESWLGRGAFATQNIGIGQQMMTGAVITIAMMLAIIALISCLRVLHSPKRHAGNRRSADHSGSADGYDSGDAISHFAGSTDANFPSHHAAAAGDAGGGGYSGGGDSGGGSDGGGGGGDGGGGGSD